MAGSTTVGYTPGTGANIVVYADASSNDHPVGLCEFLVGATPTLVSSANPLPVNFTNTTLAVTASSLPLPTGAATDANQATANASLASIDGKLTECDTTALALESGGNLATIAGKDFATQTTLASIDGKLPALGQALAAASVPVVLTALQLAALTPPAAITGFATQTTLATLLTQSDFDTKAGALTETAPATDTASSGLNGRLQRIAQRLTSLIALVPSALTGSGNFKTSVAEFTASIPAGSSIIGKVGIDQTVPGVTNAVAISSIAAGANTIGYVNAIQAGDTIEIGGTTYTVKSAFANATASGETTVVTAVASKKIRVLAYSIGPVSAAVNVYFDNATNGAITSTKYLGVNGGMGRALNHFGHFTTGTVNEALRINLSTTANVGVDVLYIEV